MSASQFLHLRSFAEAQDFACRLPLRSRQQTAQVRISKGARAGDQSSCLKSLLCVASYVLRRAAMSSILLTARFPVKYHSNRSVL